ncbi:unnamed protein product [Durusdinium trenchii]|uniref:Major facilitator superfamily (MFS) profile domain-containing protein n=4 Tax=Durusdinium trenchii TaxID=1381693 RepID=A0ABP0K874_9DINO
MAVFADGALFWLYSVVVFSQFKPSEPFLVDFLVDVKGFTNHAVYQGMFPLFTYARFPLLFVTGVLSELDMAGQGVLFLGALCGFATVLLTWFGTSLLPQQIAQITVAANFASRFAVNAVVFQLAPSDTVQQHIHTMKAALLLSNAGSAILGEILRDQMKASFWVLYLMSAIATGLAFLCSIFLLNSKLQTSAPRRSTHPASDAFFDLVKIFKLPVVAWCTVWAMSVNPAHGVALTYWQNLLKDNFDVKDYNGYMLGASYLAAAGVVAVSRRSVLLRTSTAALVILSLLAMGLTLMGLPLCHNEFVFYIMLVATQCIFELSTTVFSFQVGNEVCKAVTDQDGPKETRLALLFCLTGVISGAVASLVQHVHPIAERFTFVAIALLVLAGVLSAFSCVRHLYCHFLPRVHRPAHDPFLVPATDMMPVTRRG